MNKIIALILMLTLIVTVAGCSCGKVASTNEAAQPSQYTSNPDNKSGTAVAARQDSTSGTISVKYDSDDLDASITGASTSFVKLEGVSITVDGGGATVEGNIITITSAGTYSISGTLDDGQIRVNTGDGETVKLILNGTDITCSTSAPIYVMSAEKTVITLADGTENYVTDGDAYTFEDAESDEPSAAIFSKDDLTINGRGSLTVNANYNNGIQSKDDLKIVSGNITVNAVNNGIKGKDSVAVRDGFITIKAGGNGIQSSNGEDPAKGFVYIEGGTINITSEDDGIQAETSVIFVDGNITILSGGGSTNVIRAPAGQRNLPGNWNTENTAGSSGKAKGIKANIDITIESGTINIDSADDSIHSNDSITINGGNITLASGDDAIHADFAIEINGGDIDITRCYEGIESQVITINDGDIRIVASDDGINAASGTGGFPMIGRPGQQDFNIPVDNWLYINGGYIVIDAGGDGIDVNGSIVMTGGVVIIHGPTVNMEGAIDYDRTFDITGGFLVAAGSAGMPQAPGTSSTQYSVMVNLEAAQLAGTMICIETKDGKEVFTFVPKKAYQSVVFSSPELKQGETYIVSTGGSSTGTVTDELYYGGTYTPGTQVSSFTISGIVTTIGSAGGGFPGGGRGGMAPGGMPR